MDDILVSNSAPVISTGMIIFIVLAVIWSAVWTYIAMWKAARNNHKAWYVVLLLVGTLGILDILYIYIWGKGNKEQK